MSIPISQAIDYIENHLTQPGTIEEAAAEIGYSRYHFSRIFLSMTGLTPASYLRKRRLSEAACELVSSSRRILDIALKYQFGSQEAFTRSFRREFGVNPGHYRQRGQLQQLWETISLGLTNLLYPGQGIGHAPKLFIPEAKVVEAVIQPRPHLGRVPDILGTETTACSVSLMVSETTTIRLAHRQDIPELCRLYHKLHELTTHSISKSGGSLRLSSLWDDECFDATVLSLGLRKRIALVDVAIWVAEVRNQVVGLAEVYLREDEQHEETESCRYGYLQSMVVLESMRGLGLGQQLLQAAESWSREQGAAELRLDIWEFEQNPLRFYERQGYQTLRRTLVRSL